MFTKRCKRERLPVYWLDTVICNIVHAASNSHCSQSRHSPTQEAPKRVEDWETAVSSPKEVSDLQFQENGVCLSKNNECLQKKRQSTEAFDVEGVAQCLVMINLSGCSSVIPS